jgi:hypothetical protein
MGAYPDSAPAALHLLKQIRWEPFIVRKATATMSCGLVTAITERLGSVCLNSCAVPPGRARPVTGAKGRRPAGILFFDRSRTHSQWA